MTALTDAGPDTRAGQAWLVPVFLASLILLLIGAVHYSTGKLESMPVDTHTAVSQGLAGVEPLKNGSAPWTRTEGQGVGATSAFSPYLHIVPSQDGTELFISAGGSVVSGTVYANIGIGPGHDKGGYTMTYSDTVQAYITTAAGFQPGKVASGPLSITTTLGLDTGEVEFNRAYIKPPPIPPTTTIILDDINLSLVSTDTLATEVYIAAIRSFAPPAPPPVGHRLVGNTFRHAYSVRASGALTESNRPMILRLDYGENLVGADPHTLAIFDWDAYQEHWDNLGGTLFTSQKYVSVATRRFTTYALMATTTWRDEFFDFSGLDLTQPFSNVNLGGTIENRTLVLFTTPGSGSVISQPITPTTAITSWGSLVFTATLDPPTTTLQVDILSLSGSRVLTDVTSGTDLAGLVDPAQHPSLRLRVRMDSTAAGQTPALAAWQLSWQPQENGPRRRVYLPVVFK